MKCSELAAILMNELQTHGDCEVELFTSQGFSRRSFTWKIGNVARNVNTNVIIIDAELP